MPYGPHKITRVRQVAIPGELLRAVGLELGDNVHFRLSESDPHVIEIVPSDIVARRYQAGAESEALERLSQPSALDDQLAHSDDPGPHHANGGMQ
jgi:bifunctional DNA-binding transcriptional regulator/antitoxin component of YhaV-PrlF toxin-antitoxin module